MLCASVTSFMVTSMILVLGTTTILVHAQPIYFDETVEVSISEGSADRTSDQFYDPHEVQIAAGSAIRWTNNDNTTHTVTQGNPTEGAVQAGFSSGPIQPGDTYEHFFGESGTFDYYDTIHPHMSGKVIVNPY
jgi:plastocyanin